jgi:N-acetylglucosaminyldiphosphoundecaprenol N-acetyl-beta-D-mannosaminyltransferase
MILEEKIVKRSEKDLNVISLNVSLGTYRQLLDWVINAAHRRESRTVCFANVHMVIEAKQKPMFAQIVNSADLILPDGVPLLWAIRLVYGIKQERMTGLDVLPDLIKRAAVENLPIFFYGSTDDVLQLTIDKCNVLYPSLQIAGTYSPPFRELTEVEETNIVRMISASGAKMVFVALGCPKQEIWISRMRGRIPAVLLAIGGALPVFAGEISRSPRWMQKAGLEWFHRLLKEPRRLFKRYAVTNSLYIWYVGRQWIARK